MFQYSFLLVIGAILATAANPLNSTNHLKSGPLGVVSPNPSHCYGGESSQFIRMEVSDCTSQPCSLNVSPFYVEIAPTFRPFYASNSMRYYAHFHHGNSRTDLAVNVPIPGNFRPNYDVRVNFELAIPSSLKGATGYIEVYLLDNQRRHFNRCFDAIVSN